MTNQNSRSEPGILHRFRSLFFFFFFLLGCFFLPFRSRPLVLFTVHVNMETVPTYSCLLLDHGPDHLHALISPTPCIARQQKFSSFHGTSIFHMLGVPSKSDGWYF